MLTDMLTCLGGLIGTFPSRVKPSRPLAGTDALTLPQQSHN
jgi:hypothetical protein